MLREDINWAINGNSAENGSDTPDFILAEFLIDCLATFDKATKARDAYKHAMAPFKPTAPTR